MRFGSSILLRPNQSNNYRTITCFFLRTTTVPDIFYVFFLRIESGLDVVSRPTEHWPISFPYTFSWDGTRQAWHAIESPIDSQAQEVDRRGVSFMVNLFIYSTASSAYSSPTWQLSINSPPNIFNQQSRISLSPEFLVDSMNLEKRLQSVSCPCVNFVPCFIRFHGNPSSFPKCKRHHPLDGGGRPE